MANWSCNWIVSQNPKFYISLMNGLKNIGGVMDIVQAFIFLIELSIGFSVLIILGSIIISWIEKKYSK